MKREERKENKEKRNSAMSNFKKGFMAGGAASLFIVGGGLALAYFHFRDRGFIEYAEKPSEIEAMREDLRNRDPDEFLDTVPGVRGAADNAAAEFERKRDEALQRFRSGLAD
jgi:hypothetical protein